MRWSVWFAERQERTGVCRACRKPYANVEGEDGQLVDATLEEWELFWDCRPVSLIANDPSSNAILGEWCCPACFITDVTSFFRTSGWCKARSGISRHRPTPHEPGTRGFSRRAGFPPGRSPPRGERR